MEELYRIGISEKTIKNMIELVPSILEMSEKEIIEKELILKKINKIFAINKIQMYNMKLSI